MMKEAYFAGGCFWGLEEYYARKSGVTLTEVGYLNCTEDNPTYEKVCRHTTGCAEAVRLEYDPAEISLEELVRLFFKVVNPVTLNRQGADFGTQYRSGLYYQNDEEKAVYENAVAELQKTLDEPVVTEVLPLDNYTKAEEYHQKYLKKNPGGYCHIPLD